MPEEKNSPQNTEAQVSLELSNAKSLITSGKHVAKVANNRVKLVVVGSLLFITVGTFVFPLWWWYFLARGGFLTSYLWYSGISYIFASSLIPFLTICMILYLEPIVLKQGMLNSLLEKWFNRLTKYIYEKDRYIVFVLVVFLIINLITLDDRSKELRKRFEDGIAAQQSTVQSPLQKPSRFIFLYEKVVNSLYKQREDDVAVSKVTEEFQASKGIKGEVQISEIIKTDAEKSEVERRITEYQATEKTPEQQIKDLIDYLYKLNLLPTFGFSPLQRDYVSRYPSAPSGYYPESQFYGAGYGERSDSDKVDEAVQTLENYGLSVEQEKLARLRNRLLSKEIQKMESSLRNLQGQVLIIGDWLIEAQNDFYIFRQPFIERASDSPFCEFKLSKSAIVPESKSIILDAVNSSASREIKLGIFGSVTSRTTGQPSKVSLDPIAVYIP